MNRCLTVAALLALLAVAGCGGGGSETSAAGGAQVRPGTRARVQQQRLRRRAAQRGAALRHRRNVAAHRLAVRRTRIRAARVRALFLDSITDPRAMQRIAGETGATIGGTLYGDTLSPPGGDADTYLKMLRHDVATLKAGMLNN